jgi:O-antigen ligase/Tfp pilus assembly protein PilF
VVAAPTESAPPAGAAPALGVAPPLTPAQRTIRRRVPAGAGGLRGGGMWPWLLGFAGLLCLLSFYAKGGLDLETTTVSEIGLTVLATVVLAAGALRLRRGSSTDGLGPSLLLLAFALLSAVSIVWSVQPDNSWRDAAQLIAYAFAFAAVAILAKLGTRRWPALLGGIALASAIVCGYALLTKSLPSHFEEANRYARLYEPYGYWNALGLTAAMGAICCLWLGARRAGHAVLSALSYPAMGVLLLTLLLAYSRGALVALAVALIAWFAIVPLRLRGAAVLLSGAVAAGAIAAWDFKNNALSSETATIAEKTSAGHELGALVITMVVLLTILGVAVVFATGRRPPTAASRQRAGTALLALIAVLIVAFAGALAASHRGFSGSISHTWNTLTNTHAKLPSNSPDRLTAVASVRAQYWDEALKVFKAHPVLGVGADGYEVARLRYRTGPLVVKHAHGFIVQTLADLGLLGLAVTILLLLSWMAAAGRATHPFNRRWRSWDEIRGGARPAWMRLTAEEPGRYGPERIGLLSMICVVILFGVHSLIDWTWYVPGDAIAALLCAGWVAGRGPLRSAAPVALAGTSGTAANGARTMPSQESDASWVKLIPVRTAGSIRIGVAALAVVGAVFAIWFESQPQRSEDAREQALGQLASDPRGALAAGQKAVSRDPLSVEALFALAYVQNTEGQASKARATLRKAVRLQPSNPKTWLTLGRFDLAGDPRAALQELRAAFYLDPLSISSEALAAGQPEAIQDYNDYVQALRAVAQLETAIKTGNERRSQAASVHHAARRSARRSARSQSQRSTP